MIKKYFEKKNENQSNTNNFKTLIQVQVKIVLTENAKNRNLQICKIQLKHYIMRRGQK